MRRAVAWLYFAWALAVTIVVFYSAIHHLLTRGGQSDFWAGSSTASSVLLIWAFFHLFVGPHLQRDRHEPPA